MWLEEVIDKCLNILCLRSNSCCNWSAWGYICVGFVNLEEGIKTGESTAMKVCSGFVLSPGADVICS